MERSAQHKQEVEEGKASSPFSFSLSFSNLKFLFLRCLLCGNHHKVGDKFSLFIMKKKKKKENGKENTEKWAVVGQRRGTAKAGVGHWGIHRNATGNRLQRQATSATTIANVCCRTCVRQVEGEWRVHWQKKTKKGDIISIKYINFLRRR